MKLLLFILLLSPALRAENTLSWPQAVAEALKQNPSLASSRLAVEEAEKAVRIANAGFLPSIDLGAGWSRSGGTALDSASGLALSPESDHSHYNGSLAASWNLFDGFSTLASRALSLQALSKARATLALSSASLRLSLQQAFNQLLYDQADLSLLQKIAERYHQDTLYQELVFKSGRTPRWTYLKAKSDEADIQWQVSQLRLNLQSDQAALANLLGRDPTLPATLELKAGGDFELPVAAASDAREQAALKEHPSLRLALAGVESASAALLKSRSAFYPRLGASASYGLTGQDVWGPDSRIWSAGLSLSYNLFSGSADMAAASQAALALEASRQDLQNQRAQLSVALHKAWAAYSNAYARLPVVKLAAEAGQDRFKTVRQLYESGRQAFLDYEQAESSYTSAEQQLLAAQLNAAQAFAQFQSAQGIGLEAGAPAALLDSH